MALSFHVLIYFFIFLIFNHLTFPITYQCNMGYKMLLKFDMIQNMQFGTYHVSGAKSPASHWGGSVLIPPQIMCDFLWTK